jgi:hypothetical protein
MAKERAKIVLDNFLGNRGKGKKPKSLGKAMIKAGYSEAYAKNPDQFRKSKAWKQLMEEYLPEESLLAKHKELLNSSEVQDFVFHTEKGKKAITDKEIKTIVESIPGCRLIYIKVERYLGGKVAYYQAPDSKARDAALDKAYKLRGKYAPEKWQDVTPYSKLSNKELAEKIELAKQKLKK